MLQRDETALFELLGKIAEGAGAVVALGERRVELEQGALEESELRRDFAIDQDFQGALDERQRQIERDSAAAATLLTEAAARPGMSGGAAVTGDVLVGQELGAVLLHHLTGERAAADHEHLLVVLLQLLDQRDEVAVATDDDEGVDVVVGERHLEGVE